MTLSDEKRVIKYLLDKYSIAGKGGRPVINSSIPTVVQFGLGLIQLDLDEKKKIFTTSMWSRLVSSERKGEINHPSISTGSILGQT